MPAADDSPSKGKDANGGEEEAKYTIDWYKAQYESIQEELHDFQLSSTELEAEMEKEMEDKEKRERQLREKVDNLRYEVEEWKVSGSKFLCMHKSGDARGLILVAYRPNTSSRRLRRTMRKTPCRRRSLLCAMPIVLCS